MKKIIFLIAVFIFNFNSVFSQSLDRARLDNFDKFYQKLMEKIDSLKPSQQAYRDYGSTVGYSFEDLHFVKLYNEASALTELKNLKLKVDNIASFISNLKLINLFNKQEGYLSGQDPNVFANDILEKLERSGVYDLFKGTISLSQLDSTLKSLQEQGALDLSSSDLQKLRTYNDIVFKPAYKAFLEDLGLTVKGNLLALKGELSSFNAKFNSLKSNLEFLMNFQDEYQGLLDSYQKDLESLKKINSLRDKLAKYKEIQQKYEQILNLDIDIDFKIKKDFFANNNKHDLAAMSQKALEFKQKFENFLQDYRSILDNSELTSIQDQIDALSEGSKLLNKVSDNYNNFSSEVFKYLGLQQKIQEAFSAPVSNIDQLDSLIDRLQTLKTKLQNEPSSFKDWFLDLLGKIFGNKSDRTSKNKAKKIETSLNELDKSLGQEKLDDIITNLENLEADYTLDPSFQPDPSVEDPLGRDTSVVEPLVE